MHNPQWILGDPEPCTSVNPRTRSEYSSPSFPAIEITTSEAQLNAIPLTSFFPAPDIFQNLQWRFRFTYFTAFWMVTFCSSAGKNKIDWVRKKGMNWLFWKCFGFQSKFFSTLDSIQLGAQNLNDCSRRSLQEPNLVPDRSISPLSVSD